MARVNRRLRGIERCELRVADFFRDPLRARPDAVVCNPPYSRHQSLTPLDKLLLHSAVERRLGLKLGRRASLPVLFLARALEICADGGRIAFITPSGWLDVAYAANIKQFLVDQAHLEGLILFEARHLFFPGARTTAAISLIKKGPSKAGKTKIIQLGAGDLPAPEHVLAALGGRGNLRVERRRLQAERKWSRRSARSTNGARLADVARIKRGIATGCNRFFVLSEERRREFEIPNAQLRPCIASPRLVKGDELRRADLDALDESIPRWAINCHDPAEEAADTPLGRYLRCDDDALDARRSYLARQRRLWYGLEQRGECPILFTYFNKHRARFVRNHSHAVPLNTWLIIEPAEGVDADALFAALKTKGVIERLAAGARVYGGGLWKLEPSELGEVRLPGEFHRTS